MAASCRCRPASEDRRRRSPKPSRESDTRVARDQREGGQNMVSTRCRLDPYGSPDLPSRSHYSSRNSPTRENGARSWPTDSSGSGSRHDAAPFGRHDQCQPGHWTRSVPSARMADCASVTSPTACRTEARQLLPGSLIRRPVARHQYNTLQPGASRRPGWRRPFDCSRSYAVGVSRQYSGLAR